MNETTITGAPARAYLAVWMSNGQRGLRADRLRADALAGTRAALNRLRAAAQTCRVASPARRWRARARRAVSQAVRPSVRHSASREPARPRLGGAA